MERDKYFESHRDEPSFSDFHVRVQHHDGVTTSECRAPLATRDEAKRPGSVLQLHQVGIELAADVTLKRPVKDF